MPFRIHRRSRLRKAIVYPDNLHVIPVVEFPVQLGSINEIAQPRVIRIYVIIFEIDFNKRFPVALVLFYLYTFQHVTGKVKILEYAQRPRSCATLPLPSNNSPFHLWSEELPRFRQGFSGKCGAPSRVPLRSYVQRCMGHTIFLAFPRPLSSRDWRCRQTFDNSSMPLSLCTSTLASFIHSGT